MYLIASRSSKLKSIIGATEGSDRILQNQHNRAWRSGVTRSILKNIQNIKEKLILRGSGFGGI
jgi:hypothetical protein